MEGWCQSQFVRKYCVCDIADLAGFIMHCWLLHTPAPHILNLGKCNCLIEFHNFYCSLHSFGSQNIFLNPYQKFLKCVRFLSISAVIWKTCNEIPALTSYNEMCLFYIRSWYILCSKHTPSLLYNINLLMLYRGKSCCLFRDLYITHKTQVQFEHHVEFLNGKPGGVKSNH
jgi:hypothetical protein